MGEPWDSIYAYSLPQAWSRLPLEELATRIYGGGTPSTKKTEYWDGDIPWTTSAVINSDDILLTRYQRCLTREGLENSSSQIAPKGSVLIGTRVGVGKAVVAGLDVAINQDLTVVIPASNVLAEFLVLALKQQAIQKWFGDNKRGSTIKGVPRNDLAKVELLLPPLEEQKAIAQVLRTVQQAKEATEKVIEATRQLKASLMKHLFTYGPVPFDQADQVELKETDVGDLPATWQETKLGEIAFFKNGINFKANQKGSGILTLDVLNMYRGGSYPRMDELYRVNIDVKDHYLLEPNDLLLVRSSLKEEGVGWAVLFPGFREPVTFCGFLIRARLTDTRADPEFLVNYLRLPHIRSLLISKSGKLAITNINQGNLKSLRTYPDNP